MSQKKVKPTASDIRDDLRHQMLTNNACVAALDEALFMAKQYITVDSAMAAFRSVRQTYARRRDDTMHRLGILGHQNAE